VARDGGSLRSHSHNQHHSASQAPLFSPMWFLLSGSCLAFLGQSDLGPLQRLLAAQQQRQELAAVAAARDNFFACVRRTVTLAWGDCEGEDTAKGAFHRRERVGPSSSRHHPPQGAQQHACALPQSGAVAAFLDVPADGDDDSRVSGGERCQRTRRR
jgi:hypothetical protein